MAELAISEKYYNTLYVEGFSRMMKDPSYCYKFYWLEAIVWLISENRKEATYNEIIDEMIANAWYSVLEFHVHLSGIFVDGQIKDNLEKAVCKLQELSGLSSNASKTEIKNQIHKFDKILHTEKMELTKNVPIKALSGFANVGKDKISLDSSAGRMMEYYNKINQTSILLPYVFGNEAGLNRKLTFSEEWIRMIADHTVTILGWIQLEKVKWLQNSNPKLYEACYRDNLHSIWADQELYRKGNTKEEFYSILDKNMRPVYDSARRQGYEIWNRSIC